MPNPQERKGLPYTSTEDDYIQDYLGQESPNDVAKALKRPKRGVLHRARKLEVDPIENDGRLSVSQAGLQVGKGNSNLALYLRQGRLPAEKVGRFWRIDPETAQREVWDAKQFHKTDPNINYEGGGREDCASCGTSLNIPYVVWPEKHHITNNFWCSQRCRAEYTKAKRLELTVPSMRPENYVSPVGFLPHMRPVFQDWLAEIGILDRFGTQDELLGLKAEAPSLTENQATILDIFTRYFQLFVPHSIFCNQIFNGEIPTTGRLHEMLRRFRGKMLNPKAMNNIYELGYAAGADTNLAPEGWRLSRQFWQRIGTWVPSSYLAFSIYPDFSVESIDELAFRATCAVQKIRPSFRDSGYEFTQERRRAVYGGSQLYFNFHLT